MNFSLVRITWFYFFFLFIVFDLYANNKNEVQTIIDSIITERMDIFHSECDSMDRVLKSRYEEIQEEHEAINLKVEKFENKHSNKIRNFNTALGIATTIIIFILGWLIREYVKMARLVEEKIKLINELILAEDTQERTKKTWSLVWLSLDILLNRVAIHLPKKLSPKERLFLNEYFNEIRFVVQLYGDSNSKKIAAISGLKEIGTNVSINHLSHLLDNKKLTDKEKDMLIEAISEINKRK